MESLLESSFLDNMIGLYKKTTREDKEIYINILLISMKDIEDIEYFQLLLRRYLKMMINFHLIY